MPRVMVTSGGRSGMSFGCLGSVVAVLLVLLLAAAIALGALVLLVVVGAVLAVGLVALAVDRILLAVSPSRRARRDAMRTGRVIDTTARVEPPHDGHGESTEEPKGLPGAEPEGPQPGWPGPTGPLGPPGSSGPRA